MTTLNRILRKPTKKELIVKKCQISRLVKVCLKRGFFVVLMLFIKNIG